MYHHGVTLSLDAQTRERRCGCLATAKTSYTAQTKNHGDCDVTQEKFHYCNISVTILEARILIIRWTLATSATPQYEMAIIHLGQRLRAAKVVKLSAKFACDKVKRIDCGGEDAVQITWDRLSSKLVYQTGSVASSNKAAVRDGSTKGWKSIKTTTTSGTSKEDWVLKIHGDNLSSDIEVGIGRDTVGPIGRDLLGIVEGPVTSTVLLGAEEAGDGLEVRCVVVVTIGHQLVEERGSSEKQDGERTKVEILVVSETLLVSLVTVETKALTVKVSAGSLNHHAEESAVEGEVITIA